MDLTATLTRVRPPPTVQVEIPSSGLGIADIIGVLAFLLSFGLAVDRFWLRRTRVKVAFYKVAGAADVRALIQVINVGEHAVRVVGYGFYSEKDEDKKDRHWYVVLNPPVTVPPHDGSGEQIAAAWSDAHAASSSGEKTLASVLLSTGKWFHSKPRLVES
jgi:hypothetical protein